MKLKIGPLPNPDKVKVLVQISVELKEKLDQYAQLHSQLGGRSVDAATLIPYMLQAFIDRDRGFRAMWKSQREPSASYVRGNQR
jgi:hypothetical protein